MTLTAPATLDLLPLVETFRILDKAGRVVPFEPNWAQEELFALIKADYQARKPTRAIVLKARQLGISTASESIGFGVCAVVPNTMAAVVAHDIPSSQYLLGITKRFHETWAYRESFPLRYSSKKEMTLDRQKSTMIITTAENPNALRGRTLSFAHLSEVAFWKDPVTTMLALNQAMAEVPGNIQIIESTANGIGNWFETAWLEAKEGRNGYTPLFFPWWKHYEYIPCQGLTCRDGTCATCLERSCKIRARDSQERDLLKWGATKAHIAWRRWAIPNRCFSNLDLFRQEFPATDEEAFITSGVNAFPEPSLKAVYTPQRPAYGNFVVKDGEVSWQADASGPWRLYKKPSSDPTWRQYFLGADPSFGGVDSDYSAAQIINRRSKEQMAVFHGRINPVSFADELAKAAKFYNMATVSVETAGGGVATIERLRWIYPKIWQWRLPDRVPGKDRSQTVTGWETSWKTKAFMIMKLSEMVERKRLVLHDKDTYEEMRVYTYLGGGGFADRFGPASSGLHDDLVMSLAIAIVCESMEPALADYIVNDDPEGLIFGREDDD